MISIDEILKKLPPEARESVHFVWQSLPVKERSSLLSLLRGVPKDANLLRLLLTLSSTQLRMAFGQKHEVAIVGPANVGKSTLYNQLIHRREDRAEVSPVPGTTRTNQLADAGLFSVIDTPGADAVGALGEKERSAAISAAENADFLIILFDAIQGIKRGEQELYGQLRALGKPYIVVLNKTDLVRRDLSKVIAHTAAALDLTTEQIIPIAAKDGKNLDQVLMAIAMSEPEMMAALGRSLPEFRWKLAWRSIVSAASISAVIALTPLPVIDFAPMVVNQSIMVLGIARIYNYRITVQRSRELVATFGLAFLGRTLFYELSKFGGVPGWVLAAAISTSTTIAMGYAAATWFERGERLSSDTLSALTRRLTSEMLTSLRSLGKRKPGKKSLQEAIASSLQNSPLAENRSEIDQVAQSSQAPAEPRPDHSSDQKTSRPGG